MVGLLADPLVVRDRIDRIMAAAGYEVLRLDSLVALRNAISERNAAIIATPCISAEISVSELSDITTAHPGYPIVLVTEAHPENLRFLARPTIAAVVFLGQDEHRLPEIVRTIIQDDPFLRTAERIRRARHLPGPLRHALVYALMQEPAAVPVERFDPAAPAYTIRELARRVGISESHLARLAKRSGLDLARLLRCYAALRALHLHEVEGIAWEVVAWRFGYESLSGLSERLRQWVEAANGTPSSLDAAGAGLTIGDPAHGQVPDDVLARVRSHLPAGFELPAASRRPELMNLRVGEDARPMNRPNTLARPSGNGRRCLRLLLGAQTVAGRGRADQDRDSRSRSSSPLFPTSHVRASRLSARSRIRSPE